MIQSFTYYAEMPGQKLVVFGAVHGNEKCGTAGIRRVMAEIDGGALKLLYGQVTFVPVCNPRAYAEDVRFIERNLNRYLVPQAVPDCYEARLGNILCPILAAHDVLLDLHSYTVGGEAFVFISSPEDKKEHAFAAALGARTILYGWEKAYAATGRKTAGAQHDDEGVGTTEYMRRCGGISVTLECGQHRDPQSPEVAYRAIHNALSHLGMVEGAPLQQSTQLVQVRRVFYREDEGALAQPWRHLHPVRKNEILARRVNGDVVTAPDDGLILLPHADCPVGQEWFYFAVAGAA